MADKWHWHCTCPDCTHLSASVEIAGFEGLVDLEETVLNCINTLNIPAEFQGTLIIKVMYKDAQS